MVLLVFSWFIVAFGQPHHSLILSFCASIFGFALFFMQLAKIPEKKKRFFMGLAWFALVQAVQHYWALGHLFWVIYVPFFIYILLLGMQFGVLSIFISKKALCSIRGVLAISGLWVFMEWLRLFFLSGHPWNPVGLALAWGTLPMQTAAFGGIYLMSFVVTALNLSIAGFALSHKKQFAVAIISLFSLPFILGFVHLEERLAKENVTTALVQTDFPIEETLSFESNEKFYAYVFEEWRKIFFLLKEIKDPVDLIAFPELTVPGGTYYLIFDYEEAKKSLVEIFGKRIISAFPPENFPVKGVFRGRARVNNAFFAYTLSNFFNADLAIGLEAHDENKAFTTLTLFKPKIEMIQRYDKQLLVPMGEYVPLGALKNFAAKYGVVGTFTPGGCCKILKGSRINYGPSICYEEIVGDLIRRCRDLGADLLVNITNDGWFPGYGLNFAHFEHAKMRSIEAGIPAVRACNTGITASVDAFGRIIDELPVDKPGVLVTKVPLDKVKTLYSKFGDAPMVLLSLFLICLYPRKFI